MEEEKIVVDASVVVKWFLEEEYSAEALRIRDDYVRGVVEIAVPSLLEYEVLNALRYSRVYSVEELEEAAIALNRFGFERYELEDELKTLAVRIAERDNITVYDAAYVALAERLDTILYTADMELVRKFPGRVLHVREYGRKA